MHVIDDCAATLGSRFNLIFHPHGNCIFHNACGAFPGQKFYLTVGLRLEDGSIWHLPFCPGKNQFPYVEQFSTLTSLEYRGVQPNLGLDFRMKIRAPFYPEDARLSTAPFYYIDLTVKRVNQWRWTTPKSPVEKGNIIFHIEADEAYFETTGKGITYTLPDSSQGYQSAPGAADPQSGPSGVLMHGRLTPAEEPTLQDAKISWDFDISEDESCSRQLIWTSWQNDNILDVHGEKTPFKYHTFFGSEDELLAWAEEQREAIEKKCDFLDNLFTKWSLGQDTSDLTALAVHSFLANTWWTTRSDNSDWFSVWEGNCYYHSTIDVEYNDALFYISFWPELLDLLLDEWEGFEINAEEKYGQDAKNTSFLTHDMGDMNRVGQQSYPHYMEVEENSNYLLMLAARCFLRGDLEYARNKLPLCRRLAEFVLQSDTTGSGFPDRGAANTIDDGSPALQYGRRQVYLAIKAHSALWALGELEELLCEKKKESKSERWKAFASKGVKTLAEKAWIKDHYAITVERQSDGIVNPWTGEEMPPGELKGWDDYSVYTTNGLLYLFMANVKMPRWNQSRMAQDIESAEEATRTPYGCRHTSGNKQAVWFSQNLWRDMTACYVGIDMLDNVERYWSYQLVTGDGPNPSLYCDTTPENNLAFYPRGATILGLPMAAGGMQLNRVDSDIHFAPVRNTLRVPLLLLANWQEMRVPWLFVDTRDGVTTARITERELLQNFTIHMTGAELEQS
jgi:hypothetical protein